VRSLYIALGTLLGPVLVWLLLTKQWVVALLLLAAFEVAYYVSMMSTKRRRTGEDMNANAVPRPSNNRWRGP